MIDKRIRFFRRYELRFKPRAAAGYALPLVAKPKEISVIDALRIAAAKQRVALRQPNGDVVDLVRIDDSREGVLVLLFHRTSPTAADPAYRKFRGEELMLRMTKKEMDEDQAQSAHLVISTKRSLAGAYAAALEEVPGLSLTTISTIIKQALDEYKYPYKDKRQKEQETYSTFKAFGIKAESLEDTLKKDSSISYLKLTRTNIPDAPDADGIAEARSETIRYRIIGNPRSSEWRRKLNAFYTKIKAADWDDITLDINLEDNRHRTVKLDREREASEVMFVRAEQVRFERDLDPCTIEVVPEVVRAAQKLLKA